MVKHYPLPNKNHDVLEDLARINDAFTVIDDDITLAENSVSQLQNTVTNLDAKSLTIPQNLDINTEIQHIKVNNYLVTNKDGTGFSTTEGGGNEGGLLGQCLAKASDENYKTAWGNFWEIGKHNDECHIFDAEENATDQLPKSDLVQKQSKSDVFSGSNDSFIFKDSIEQITDTPQLATHLNYGFVKVGNGIDVDEGVISVPRYGSATISDFGLIKVGDGISVVDGIISVQPIETASHSAFGVVKLSDDFELNENGGLKLAKKSGDEPVIYKLAKMKIVNNGVIELEENTANYRAFINEDIQFSLDIGFVPKADFSFTFEIISDGKHMVGFDAKVPDNVTTLGVNRGITVVKFTKLLGADFWDASIDLLEAPEPVLLTPNNGDSIKSDLILSSNGSSWDPYSMMGADVGNIAFYNNPREIHFDFAKSAVVDSVYFYDSNNATLSLFEFLASNDKVNWTRLIYKSGSVIGRKNVATERKGAFHYFKLRFSGEGNIRGIQLYGAMIANNDSELILLTPSMGSNSVAGITISGSNLRANNWRDVTYPSANSYIELNKGTSSDAWIQYEFATPQLANFLDMASQQDSTYRTARWFKLIASNDGSTWDLLLERQYQEDWKQCETRYFEFENTTAYKYYRLVCSYTNDASLIWRISRFRLFRRENGTSSFINVLPKLISASQDGYEVSANSTADSGHVVTNVFDGNADTKWATASGDYLNSWLKIKLPEAVAINAAYLQARNDGYYYQAPSAKIQASNDGTSWTDMTYQSASWLQKEGKIFYWQNETPYLYYRLLIESVQSGSNAGLAEFSLGRRAKTYRRYLTQYNYLTPAMTSDSMSGFLVSASSEYSGGEGAWRAFDRTSNQWTTVNGTNKNVELKIKLPAAASCGLISITGSNGPGRCPSTFYIQGSNDNAIWVNLISQTTPLTWGSSETKTWEISNPTLFLYYRLYVLTNNGDGFLSVQEFSLINKTIVQEY